MTRKAEAIKRAQENVMPAKRIMIDALSRLEEAGAKGHANQLARIIGRLEAWQNS